MLRFPNKDIRAAVIASYVRSTDYPGVVAFSCGNATRALKRAGLRVVDISPDGDLEARRWWCPEQIRAAFPHLFDATSGHLPPWLMNRIANAYRRHLGDLPPVEYAVPTGSGETVVCLAMAYPDHRFRAVYGLDAATEYHSEAPLNALVRALCAEVEFRGGWEGIKQPGPVPPGRQKGTSGRRGERAS